MIRCLILFWIFALNGLIVNSQCVSGQQLFNIQLSPDFFADEISWELIQNNTLVLTGNSNSDSTCIDTSECIIFVIKDSGNDGICCNYGNGFYEVFVDQQKIGNGSSFGAYDSIYLNCPNISDDDFGVFIPTAFSPNDVGNSSNNQFSIIVDETVKEIYFYIYDRWGELIFTSNNLYFSWDGTFRGKNCMSGIYAYQAIIFYNDGKKKIKTGNTTLIR
jgi:gliding motility-associated-like protein